MHISIEDIINEIVDSIDKSIDIIKIVDAAEQLTKLYLCDFKWLQLGSIVSDGTNDATVTEIGVNYIIVDKGLITFTWIARKLYIVKNMYFMRGTPIAVNGEYKAMSNDERNKTPLSWLVKPIKETNNLNGQGFERISDIRMFFLNVTNPSYTEKQHNEKVLSPLWQWVIAFFKAIDKNKNFGKIDSYDSRELNRFGTETAQGFEKNIIDSNLSAIDIKFSLPIRSVGQCFCNIKKDYKIQYLSDGENLFLYEGNKVLSFN